MLSKESATNKQNAQHIYIYCTYTVYNLKKINVEDKLFLWGYSIFFSEGLLFREHLRYRETYMGFDNSIWNY